MRRMVLMFVATMLLACASTEEIRELPRPAPEYNYVDPGPKNIRELERTSVLIKGSNGGRATGVVVKTGNDHSYVLTAGHIYHKDAKYSVYTSTGKHITGCWIVVYKALPDLAVLYVPKPLKAIELARSMPARGSRIYTSGNKLGGGFWPSDGIYGGIIYTGSKHPYSGKFARGSIPTHPGNSGGGVVYDCKLVGIVSRILVHKKANLPGQILPTTLLFVPVTVIHPYLTSVEFKMKGQAPKRQEAK